MSIKSRSFSIAAAAMLLASVNYAQNVPGSTLEMPTLILASAAGGVNITSIDIMAELQRAPENVRQSVLTRPEALQQLINNLMIRRMLAHEGSRDGLDKNSLVTASLEIARDRALSDARLAVIDQQNQPSEAALDAYARNLYLANASQFERAPETRARHILIDNAGPESLEKAKDLLKQIRQGASFEELAKAHSTDKVSADRGGDLGFFQAGKMVRPFEDAVAALKVPGEVSEPVESQFGYHIIKLEERRGKSRASFDDVREQLLVESRTAILNTSRLQKIASLNKEIKYETAVIDQMVKSRSK